MELHRAINSASCIQRHLQTTLLEEEVVELQLHDRSRTFFTRLIDKLPPMKEFTDEDGSIILQEPEYPEGSYLQQQETILIAPMEPVGGNILIRRSQQVFLRIPIGTNSLECESRFLGIQTVRDAPFIALAFPLSGLELSQRRYYRAKTMTKLLSQVIVTLPNNESASCPLIDIGINGLAFENPWPSTLLPPGTPVTIQFARLNLPDSKLFAVVRNHITCRKSKDCKIVSSRCGIQFSVEDMSVARQLERVVAEIQREHLRILRERADEAGIDLMPW
jgi:c-di-GMP-binding flagellar brake protein YcgR